MIPYLRQEKILALLHDKGIATIDEIKDVIIDASVSTLRRDLKILEDEGKVVLLIGGAVKLASNASDLPACAKKTMHKLEKEAIAKIASQLIKDGDVIYLDSGTTCTALMRLIDRKKITVVTSNTSILQVSDRFACEVIFLGGRLNDSLYSVNGPLTDSNIALFNFDKAFLGANGVDAARGVTTPTIVEASKKKQVARQSKEVYLLCDSSKFGKVRMMKAFDLDQCVVISNAYNEEIGAITKLLTPHP